MHHQVGTRETKKLKKHSLPLASLMEIFIVQEKSVEPDDIEGPFLL